MRDSLLRRRSAPVDYGGEHRLRSENLAFDADVWYPCVAQHTMRTAFLPLTCCEAAAIVAYYDATFRSSIPQNFTTNVVATLEALEAKINELLEKDASFRRDGAFLRLCGRSPKDGEPTDPVVRASIWESYLEALQKVQQRQVHPEDDDDTGNTRVAAISTTPSYLRVRTGADAMSLLLTSERVFTDMRDWLSYGEPEQLVFREFVDSFDVSTEFRCYIHHGILVGISQYDTYAKYAFLQDASVRGKIVCAVIRAWRKVKDCIETMDGSYCLDFGVDLAKEVAYLIELSCFRNCTGPALFAWKGEANLVISKRADVQDDRIESSSTNDVSPGAVFRVRSKAIPGIGELVDMNWDYRWSLSRHDIPKPYREVYGTAIPQQIGIMDQLRDWFFPTKEPQHLLFVYGTLKRHCHWHTKYMSGAHFLGNSTTADPQTLVLGDCGVPYLVRTPFPDDKALNVKGELYKISGEILQNIDEYEGIDKCHYIRKEIPVVVSGTSAVRMAFCYFYATKPGASGIDASLYQAERISEYTAEEQFKQYKPIHHIQAKQLQYLGEEATT